MIVQLLTSFTGALGFCLVFHLRRRYMFAASLGGLLTCGVYLAAASIWSGILLLSLIHILRSLSRRSRRSCCTVSWTLRKRFWLWGQR